MKIILRTCENLFPANGPRPIWCIEKNFKFKCFKSLVNSISVSDVEIYIIGDCLSDETIELYNKLYPKLKIINSIEKIGNSGSLIKVFGLADSFPEDDIVYFCEDDYLHNQDFYKGAVNFFDTIANKFEDVFFHPTDCPDQYFDSRMRRNYLFKSDLNGWYKEIDSVTFTFATQVKTYKKYSNLLKDCAIRNKVGYDRNLQPIFHPSGADDARFSEIFGFKNPYGYTNFHQTALCFCPLPGTASHMHIGAESLYFNWRDFYKKIEL